MVGVLWEAGRVESAIALEELWNELSAELPFSLFCAYPGGEEPAADPHATRRVRGLHDVVVGVPTGSDQPAPPALLAREIEQHFDAQLDAPRAARRFAVDAVADWGWTDLVDTVELVVAELATNAVVHAKSRFVVTLTCRSTGVRVAVRDDSPAAAVVQAPSMTAFSGRGLAIVDALATSWGVDQSDDGPSGKVLWAEIEA
jgi:anti-sigma regulatory factor (Ser/Thr protein kinase)